MLTEQQLKDLNKVFKANADKQLSLSKVLSTSLAAIVSERIGDDITAAVGATTKDDARKEFVARFMNHMPHVVYNGSDKITVVDFFEAPADAKNDKFIKAFRLAGSDVVELETCVNFVETEQEVKQHEKVTLASGFELDVISRDADGNVISDTKQVRLTWREKTVWGYTDTVKNAIIAALNELV